MFYKTAKITDRELRECFLLQMLRNKIPKVCLFLFHGTEFREFFSMVRNGIPKACFFFCSTVRNFLFSRMVRNDIPSVFCSAEQPKFCRNKPFVSSILSAVELFFFVGNSQPYPPPRTSLGPT
jgi:hypothetical protein